MSYGSSVFGKTTWGQEPSGSNINSLVVNPSGGISFAGASSIVKSGSAAPSGGISLAGTAPFAKGVSRSPIGGIVLIGSAPLVKSTSRIVSGGINFAGTAPYQSGGAVTSSAWIVIARRRRR